MPRCIIKLKDKYLEWSTVVDAPISPAMTLEQLKEFIRFNYGQRGIDELPERLKRVEEKGNSFQMGCDSAEELVSGNRAGENETELTIDEILKEYSE